MEDISSAKCGNSNRTQRDTVRIGILCSLSKSPHDLNGLNFYKNLHENVHIRMNSEISLVVEHIVEKKNAIWPKDQPVRDTTALDSLNILHGQE